MPESTVHDGVLDPRPLAGIPKVHAFRNAGLFDIALHPKFAENKLVYFTYSKPGTGDLQATTLARGRLDGAGLTDVRDLFSGEWTNVLAGSRIAFAPDGNIFMTTGAGTGNAPQDPLSDYGKVLRLRDDGTVPKDNPFFDQALHKPEIYSLDTAINSGLPLILKQGQCFRMRTAPTAATRST